MIPTILHAGLFNYNNVGSDSNLNLLKQEILENTTKFPNSSFSNVGCWRGTQKLHNIKFLLEVIETSVKEQFDYYAEIDNSFSRYCKQQFDIHYWANVNSIGSRNVMHAHKPGILSGVYYIQGDGTGDLRIINPANILGECNPGSPFSRDFFFTPKDRDLIMWPSWLPHEVEPNLSSKDRINIAFDIRFKNEN